MEHEFEARKILGLDNLQGHKLSNHLQSDEISGNAHYKLMKREQGLPAVIIEPVSWDGATIYLAWKDGNKQRFFTK